MSRLEIALSETLFKKLIAGGGNRNDRGGEVLKS